MRIWHKGWRLVGLCLATLFLAGCLRPATAPLAALTYGDMHAHQHKNLLVLLRGMGSNHEIFAREGIIDEIRRRQLPFDIVAPDLHFGYYRAQNLEERLKADIIDPYRRQGYEHIWLAGFSMGGLGSLFYLRSYPEDVDGALLISPFIGWDRIIDEIEAAGGVGQWRKTGNDTDDWQRLLWTWIKAYAADPDAYPPVFLGYGAEDDTVDGGPRLLATVLPAERVLVIPGEHDIPTFKTIFFRQLEEMTRTLPLTAKALE